MYTQCDPDANVYILLEDLIDVKRIVDFLTLDQQQIIVNGTTCQHRYKGLVHLLQMEGQLRLLTQAVQH